MICGIGLLRQAQPGLRVIALPFDRDQLTGKAAKKALHWRQKQVRAGLVQGLVSKARVCRCAVAVSVCGFSAGLGRALAGLGRALAW